MTESLNECDQWNVNCIFNECVQCEKVAWFAVVSFFELSTLISYHDIASSGMNGLLSEHKIPTFDP